MDTSAVKWGSGTLAQTAEEKIAYWQRRKAEEEGRVLTAANQTVRDVHRRMALAYAKRLAGEPIE